MDWLSSGEMEITDLGDRLEVVYRRQEGLLGWVFSAVAGAGAIYAFWKTSELIGILVVAVFAFSLLNSFRKGNETRMVVRPDGFIVEGNIDSAFRERIAVSVDDIYGVEYFVGNEGSPSGLYARGTWRSTCLIPGINRESCQQIQSAIEEKFPDMHFGQGQLSSIFGTGPDIVTLGLNKPTSPPQGNSSEVKMKDDFLSARVRMPQGLKPRQFCWRLVARLKPCPFKARG